MFSLGNVAYTKKDYKPPPWLIWVIISFVIFLLVFLWLKHH